MKKVLFFIHDLGQGGAEKVLVSLVNNMDYSQFDVTVMALFGGGVNEQFLSPRVHYKALFNRSVQGNTKLMKLFTPRVLHKLFIKDHYDIEVSFLEGPSARIIAGCLDRTTKTVCWIHSTPHSKNDVAKSFRSISEAVSCYQSFDKIVCVSKGIEDAFLSFIQVSNNCQVLYNPNDSKRIRELAEEEVQEISSNGRIKLCAVGSLKPVKGFDRLLRIVNRLKDDGNNVELIILGIGPLENTFRQFIKENQLDDSVKLHGYQLNPYKYISKCDLFVCSSHSEGFSTAATEALIVGTPVCTVDVSGMKELLGENNEYGVVTENNEENLYEAIKNLVTNPQVLAEYRAKAAVRGQSFGIKNTIGAIESFFKSI